MASSWYDYGIGEIESGSTNWTSSTIKILLLKGTGYTFDKAHRYVSDLTPGSNECTAGGYARQTLGSKTRTVNTTDHRVELDAADVSFGALAAAENITAAVIFRDAGGADSANPLLGYLDNPDLTTTGGAATYQFPTSGVLKIDNG